MPKKEIDYSKTIIYKIVSNDLNITECYVGHTTNFIQRKGSHKFRCNTDTDKKYNLKIYQFIRSNGGWDNFSMIEIEKYPCNDFNEASAKERYWYEQLNSNLNSCYPGRTMKEYRKTNKQKIREKQNQKFNCECGGKYTLQNKLRHLNFQKHKKYITIKDNNLTMQESILEPQTILHSEI
jgi:hypothetical protein